MSAEELYEVWREEPSLHWNQIVNPVNISPADERNETAIFIERWNRLAVYVNARTS